MGIRSPWVSVQPSPNIVCNTASRQLGKTDVNKGILIRARQRSCSTVLMNLARFLFGRPLRSDAEAEEQIGPIQGIPVLGLDALASASYGPEAALTILLVVGAAASQQIVPVSVAIIGLLLIVYFSYRQTIAAYPNGGGSFTVAKENLGADAGLIA